MTDAIDKLLLTNITTDPDRDFFDVMDFDGLAADLESIINSVSCVEKDIRLVTGSVTEFKYVIKHLSKN